MSLRGANFYSALVLVRASANFASLPLCPSRSARLQMPNSVIALRVRGFAQPPPGRGVRVGVSPLNAGWELSARAPRGSAGTAPGSALPARLLWALPAEFGVATGRVCVKLEKEDGRLSSPSFSFTLKMARAATTSQGGEGDNSRGERTSPKQKGGAEPSRCLPHSRSAECGTVLRRAALTVRPEPSSSLPSRVTRCVCVRALGEAGVIGKFQHLRRSALWSLEGNGYFSNVFTSDHPLCPWWGWCWRTAVEC